MADSRAVRREVIITGRESGVDFLSYMVKRFTYQNREQWLDHMRSGKLLLNGCAAGGSEILRENDRIAFIPDMRPEPAVDTGYKVLYEDKNFLFIDKPPDLPCHPGGIYLRNTLWYLLKGKYREFFFINRIDRETSGIVAVAKNRETAAWAFKAMAERRIGKEYLVLTEGIFTGTVDAKGWLIHDEESPIRKKRMFIPDNSAEDPGDRGGPERQFSRTVFTALENRPDGTSLINARLHTGKTHQIRATLWSLGFPLVGDKLYGREPLIFLRFPAGEMTEDDRTLLKWDHQALHSMKMVFALPDGTVMDIFAEPPDCWNIPGRTLIRYCQKDSIGLTWPDIKE